MNPFSLNRRQTTELTGALVLTVLAVVFFVFPFSAYAMKGSCGKKGSTQQSSTLTSGLSIVDKAITKTHVIFTLNGVYEDQNGNPIPAGTGWGPGSSRPISLIALSTGKVTSLAQGEWVSVTPAGGKPINATILDAQGLTVTIPTNSVAPIWGILTTDLPIKVAATGSSSW